MCNCEHHFRLLYIVQSSPMSHHIAGEMAKLGTDQYFLLDIIESDRRYGAIFLNS